MTAFKDREGKEKELNNKLINTIALSQLKLIILSITVLVVTTINKIIKSTIHLLTITKSMVKEYLVT